MALSFQEGKWKIFHILEGRISAFWQKIITAPADRGVTGEWWVCTVQIEQLCQLHRALTQHMLTTTQSPQHPLAPILSVIISETLRASLLERVRWLISRPRLLRTPSASPIRLSVSLLRFPHVQSEIKPKHCVGECVMVPIDAHQWVPLPWGSFPLYRHTARALFELLVMEASGIPCSGCGSLLRCLMCLNISAVKRSWLIAAKI